MLLIVAALAAICGCKTTKEDQGVTTSGPDKSRVFLTVDFKPGQTLRYRFASKRTITVDWDPNAAATKNRVQKHEERADIVVAYTPVEVDPFGVSTVLATVESVETVRSGGVSGRAFGVDAVVADGHKLVIDELKAFFGD